MKLPDAKARCSITPALYDEDNRWPVLPWFDRSGLSGWNTAPRAYVVILNLAADGWYEIQLTQYDNAFYISNQLTAHSAHPNRISDLVDPAVASDLWLALTIPEFAELNRKPWSEIPHVMD